MNPDRQRDRLLDEIADEVLTPGFREALLASALGLVRRRRRIHRAQRVGLFAVLMAGLSAAIWEIVPLRRPGSPQSAFGVVHTRTLPTTQIVKSETGVATVTTTTRGQIAELATASGGQGFTKFSDSDLLAFFSGKPVVLVSVARGQAELIFLDPSDAAGFELH